MVATIRMSKIIFACIYFNFTGKYISHNMKLCATAIVVNLLLVSCVSGQKRDYADSILAYQKDYVDSHEVVGTADKQYIHFYEVGEKFKINATFQRIVDKKGFDMNTSSGMKKHYFLYGLLGFQINDTPVQLYIYQAQLLMHQEKYKDYLFVPFGDATSGYESYGGGRYLDFRMSDIKNNHLAIDFNKAYNPYCAYTTGYNCPIPPKGNLLKIAIAAGEKNYGKPYH